MREQGVPSGATGETSDGAAPAAWSSLPRFLLVGVANTVCGVLAFRTAAVLLDGHPSVLWIAQACSYAAATVCGFVCNRRWTFRSTAPLRTQVWKFAAVQLTLLVGSATALDGAVRGYGVALLPAWSCVTAVTTILGFVLFRQFVFAAA